jgi:hypothetical protein
MCWKCFRDLQKEESYFIQKYQSKCCLNHGHRDLIIPFFLIFRVENFNQGRFSYAVTFLDQPEQALGASTSESPSLKKAVALELLISLFF